MVEAPQTWRPGWIVLALMVAAATISIVQSAQASTPARIVLVPAIVWYAGWYAVFVINGKSSRVTFDGEVVEVRTPFARSRFRPSDIGSVVVPTIAATAVLRLDHVERIVLGRRSPWPWPWRRPVTPFVVPRWFVEVVGVPASRVRPGGLRWVASRLLRRPMTFDG